MQQTQQMQHMQNIVAMAIHEIVRSVKEQLSYIALDYDTKKKAVTESLSKAEEAAGL